MSRGALAVLFMLASACGDNEPQTPDAVVPGDGNGDASDPDAPPVAATFTSFVLDLVTNQTAGNTGAVPFADFSELPDPDSDNTAAYASLFP